MTARPFEDVWARSEDGLRLHARLYGGLSGQGLSGHVLPIVGLPGLARTAADLDELARQLTGEASGGRALIAVDYRGRGRSDYDPDPSHYTVPVEAADVVSLLAELGIERATFVGTSRGGLITMALAASRPGLVAGAVLNDVGPVLELAGLLRIKGYVGRLATPAGIEDATRAVRELFGPQFPGLAEEEWQRWAGSTWRDVEGALTLDYDPQLARTLDAIEDGTELPDLWPLFSALKGVPVLAVRGGLSDLLSAGTLARMEAEHPDLEALTVADEGHTPFLHRPEVLAAVRRLVARADETSRASAPVG